MLYNECQRLFKNKIFRFTCILLITLCFLHLASFSFDLQTQSFNKAYHAYIEDYDTNISLFETQYEDIAFSGSKYDVITYVNKIQAYSKHLTDQSKAITLKMKSSIFNDVTSKILLTKELERNE